jgi:hypothetical protein
MSLGAVMVAPHFGQGADTPARWVGTRSFASQFVQVNLIFFTFVSLKWFPALVVFLYALAYKFRDARVRRGLRLILVSARLSAPTMLKNFNIDTHKCNK